MKLHRFDAPGLAHYSYLIASSGTAAVVDPKRDIDTYVAFAAENNLRITHILETHIHADYASGARELAEATGAEMWLSGHDDNEDFEYQFPHRPFRDGEELQIGDLRIVALHTPGHTPEHLCFLAHDLSRGPDPMLLLSGDFVFVGSLGRPDLLGEEAKHQLASQLYDSVHRKIAEIPDYVEVHPAHGAGSLCGAGLGERSQTTLGYERRLNGFMGRMTRKAFIDRILGTVPPFPDYYRRMKRVNSEGAPMLHGVPGGTPLAAGTFRELVNGGAAVVDVRRPEAFGGAHVPGSFQVTQGMTFGLWVPFVVPYDRPVLLVGEPGSNLEEVRRALIRVGIDDLRGYLKGGMASWIEAGYEQGHVPQISVVELAARKSVAILDVRTPAEWASGHIEGALHLPANELADRMGEVPPGTLHVICGSGFRSSIASSLLKRADRDVVNVVGGMNAWRAQRLPEVAGQPAAACSR